MKQTITLLFLFLYAFNTQAQLRALSESEVEKYTKIVEEKGDSSLQVAYQLAIHYKRKGNEIEKYKHYCLYIIDETKDNPANYYSLRALRAIAIVYLQSSMVDSMHYYTDKLIEATEVEAAPDILRFRGMAYNIKAGEHFSITMDSEKAYPLLIKAMEIAKNTGYASDYLNAAFFLCDLINRTEPQKIPEAVEEIEKTVKEFKNPPVSKYIFREIQAFKHNFWLKNPNQSSEQRAASLAFYRSVIRDLQEDQRVEDMIKKRVEMTKYFKKELGKDSVLYYTSQAYDFYKDKSNLYLDKFETYYQYAVALYDNELYSKAIPIFKEIIPFCGIKELPKPISTEDRLEGDYSLLADTYQYLAKAYLNLGNTKKAKEYVQKFADASDNRQTQAIGNVISDLKVKYDLEKTKIENETLFVEKNLAQNRFQYSSIIGLLLFGLLGVTFAFFLEMLKNKKELEQINEGKNQLFEIVAHDLKGPVASFSDLSFNVSHLIKTNQNQRLLELADYYEKAGRRINYILVNLLDWAISQKDQFVHQPQNIDVKTEINSIINELNYSISQKKITIKNQIVPNTSMFFDKDAFKVILRNILHNAIKFSYEDSTVIVDFDEFGLKIKDSGIGMNAATIQKVLKKQRVKSNFGTNAEKGNGIGLSTCVKLAEQNNAQLQISSKLGEETIFTLTNPK